MRLESPFKKGDPIDLAPAELDAAMFVDDQAIELRAADPRALKAALQQLASR